MGLGDFEEQVCYGGYTGGLQHGLAVGVSVGDVGRSHGLSESSVVGVWRCLYSDSAVRASYWSADMRLSISERSESWTLSIHPAS